MITSLSAYKEMIEAAAGLNAGQKLKAGYKNALSIDSGVSSPEVAAKLESVSSADAVAVDISVSQDVFAAVDSFFNLGKSGRVDDVRKLSPEDKKQFEKIVGALASAGYAGYEELMVNNKLERHEILNQIGDRRLRHAKVYDASKDPRR